MIFSIEEAAGESYSGRRGTVPSLSASFCSYLNSKKVYLDFIRRRRAFSVVVQQTYLLYVKKKKLKSYIHVPSIFDVSISFIHQRKPKHRVH